MNVEIQTEAPVRPGFASPRVDAVEPPVRVVEYVRPRLPALVEREPRGGLDGRPPISPHSRVPGWLRRLLLVWGLLTLASLVGPCRPLSPSPALAVEAPR